MHLSDQLTAARALAVPVVIVLFAWDFPNHDYWATAVFRRRDGDRLARRVVRAAHGPSSDLGRLLDPVADKLLVMAAFIMLVGRVLPAWMVAAIIVASSSCPGLRLAALERGVVIGARDLGKLKTATQALAAGLGGLAAGGAFSDDIAWWAFIALVFTWVSGLDYLVSAPRVFRGQQPA